MNTNRRSTLAGLIGLISSTALWAAEPMVLPPLKKQASPEKVLAEHLDAVEKSDWNRLVAQFPEDGEVHMLDGQVAKGRAAIGKLFVGFVTPRPNGLKGIRFVPQTSAKYGDTIMVYWKAEAPFLAEPYYGSDAYITHDGMMAGMVTTFDGSKLKFKK
ncbi:nuclear transport factor 2 family protein [Massilia sp. HP4]|uniref:nuclear transport factor 2 family protein n=1 Tax=Massilia sp. HP4 TaxID=2562316 RepID=UPI0010BF7791|nr:nuclear transport factor 2 family protein [Massilia sp. HP4]